MLVPAYLLPLIFSYAFNSCLIFKPPNEPLPMNPFSETDFLIEIMRPLESDGPVFESQLSAKMVKHLISLSPYLQIKVIPIFYIVV